MRRLRRHCDEVFADRDEAGRRLAEQLAAITMTNPVVFGLARGGVIVAEPVAAALAAPLEVAVARKIGAPGRRELGVGAVTADGPPIYDERSLQILRLRPEDLARSCEAERAEARRRVERYRDGRSPEPVAGRDVVLVDDGLATGVTARAAVGALREQQPRRVLLAVPVGARGSAELLATEVDELICLHRPHEFGAVGLWYRDFGQVDDDEVLAALARNRGGRTPAG